MPITFSYRVIAVAAGAAIAGGMQALPPALAPTLAPTLASQAGARTAADHQGNAVVLQKATSTAAQAATVRYWTTARMTAALRESRKPATTKRSLVKRSLVKPSLVKRLVKKAAPKQPAKPARPQPRLPGPWLTGNTNGQGLRWTHDGTVADAVGKVFFTLNGEDYVCSGTLVGGKEADVVLTAAHCVTGGVTTGGTPDWATNWMFVPGYRDGQLPYGEYTARSFFVTPDWTGPAGDNEQYDVAFAVIATGTLHGGAGTASAPPSLPIAFTDRQDAAPASRAYVFGYPSLAPYTGLYPNYCAGQVTASDGSLRTACAMTAGDSGGPWLAGFSPLSGTGTVVAVSTYKVSDDLSVLYGAVLGPQARDLYARAVSSAG